MIKLRGHALAMFAVACWLFVSVLAAGCSRTPPEVRLRASMAALQSAIERRDPSQVEDLLADDFIGPDGLDRAGARQLAQLMFLRHRNVGLAIGPLEMDAGDSHASVRFTAAVTGGEGVLPERGQVYDVETGWRLEGGEWRLVNARWTRRL